MRILGVNILIGLLLLIACTKRKHIKVTIYNPITQSPVSNVPYEIAKWVDQGITPWGPSKHKVAKTGKTDENGKFTVTKWIRGNSKYHLKIDMPSGYYPYINGFLLRGLERKTDTIIYVARSGTIDVKLQNIDCYNPEDELIITQKHEFFVVENIDDNDTIVLKGCFNWERLKTRQPEGIHYFKSEFKRNGITKIRYDTLYVNPGLNTSLSLQY